MLAPKPLQAFDLDVVYQGADTALIIRMGVALALGALIGLERERRREAGTVLAGIRTYPLVCLAGALFARIGEHLAAPSYVAVGAAAMAMFAGLLYYVRHQLGIHGLTSPIALFVTYLVGAFVGFGFLIEGTIGAVAVTILLFTRTRLHRLAEVMTEQEMAGALQFAIVAFILFPITADRPIDPWEIINPHEVLLIVTFVAGISFVSFLAMRFVGTARGLELSGLLGGLVNSEAATVGLAQLARDRTNLEKAAVAGIVLTNATMLVRNLLVAGFVDPSLAFMRLIAPGLVSMFAVQAGFVAWKRRGLEASLEDAGEVRLKNPFAIKPALRFGLLFIVLQLAAFALTRIPGAGEKAILLTAMGGLVSSAAVVASVGALAAGGQVSVPLAATTAVLASVVSTLAKLLITRSAARNLLRPIQFPMLVPTVVGMTVLVATLWWLRTTG